MKMTKSIIHLIELECLSIPDKFLAFIEHERCNAFYLFRGYLFNGLKLCKDYNQKEFMHV